MLLVLSNSHSQSRPSRRYTTRDGLIADRVTAIAQDHQGNIWIGTLFGISKYDGVKFTTLPLPREQQNKTISCLLAAHQGLYAGFIFGGGFIEFKNGKATSFHINHQMSTTNDIIVLGAARAGVLVCNASNQVFLFKERSFEFLFQLDSSHKYSSITSLEEDNNGRIWAGTAKGILVFEHAKQLTSLLDGNSVLYVRNTRTGMLVAANDGKVSQLHYYSFKGQQPFVSKMLWKSATLEQIRFSGSQTDSYYGRDREKGILRISADGDVDVLPSIITNSEIRYVFADHEKNVWLANDPGIVKLSNMPVSTYQFDELGAGGADIIRTDDSTLWATNSKTLYKVTNTKILRAQEFRTKQTWDHIGRLFHDEKRNLWVSGWDKGLWKLRYKGTELLSQQYYYKFEGTVIKAGCCTKDKSGNTWIGGINGIFHIRNSAILGHFDVPSKITGNAFITAIAVDERRKILWCGDNSGGLIKLGYQMGQNGKCEYAVIAYYDDQNGLTDPYIRSLYLDERENLWIGTRLGGIYLMSRADEIQSRVRSLAVASGISCSRVTDISEEKGRAMWFATCDGLLRYSTINFTWQKFGVSDGLTGAETFSIHADADMPQVWSTSNEGVSRISFGRNETSPPPPIVNITAVTIVGVEDSTALFDQSKKDLSPDKNSIGFVFAAASFIDEKKVRYKYMLEGYDSDWSIPVESNSVNYLSLPFGDYTFKVSAWNGSKWSETPATFSFNINRPFYKSPWFYGLLAALAAITFYAVRTYRLQQKLKLEKLRLSIARDLHDDIGSTLGSINLLSENANRQLQNNVRVQEVAGIFQKIGHSAQAILDAMDDIIWAINPEKDSLEHLLIRIREFAIPLLEARNITFDLNIKVDEDKKPSMEIKRNIYLIFKEAIHNVLRHSNCSKVWIDILFNAKVFELKIADNGSGFDPHSQNSRNGLKNMRKRSAMSGAELKIESEKNGGTIVHLRGTW